MVALAAVLHDDGVISGVAEWSREQTCARVSQKDALFQRAAFPWLRSPTTTFPGKRTYILPVNELGFYHWPYLRCGWLARSEPWSRLGRPGSIPPSGSESSLALVSGCRCGCGQRRAKSSDRVCLWWPAAGAGRAKEPRQEHLAPWVWAKTRAWAALSLQKHGFPGAGMSLSIWEGISQVWRKTGPIAGDWKSICSSLLESVEIPREVTLKWWIKKDILCFWFNDLVQRQPWGFDWLWKF